MTSDTISDCTTGGLTDWLMLRICRRTAKQQKTVRVMCLFLYRSKSKWITKFRTDRTGWTRSEPTLNVSFGIWFCRRYDAHHRTSVFAMLSCSRLDRVIAWHHKYTQERVRVMCLFIYRSKKKTRSSDAVQDRTDDRSQKKSTCHRHKDAAATRVSQLDRSGLLYTVGRGSVPRPTVAGHWTGRPLETLKHTANKLRSTAEKRNKPSVPSVTDTIRHVETMQERHVVDCVESGSQIE